MIILFWFFAAIILYHTVRFIEVLVKMRQRIQLPVTAEEMASIRKEPQRKMKVPTYKGQKGGIIFYISFLLFIIMTAIFWILRDGDILPLLVPLIYSIFGMSRLMNQFAFINDGVLSGSRFIPWKRIQSYEFIKIDVNHRYYGHSKEVNDQLELRVKTRFWTYKCIIMTEEMKMKVEDLFEVHGIENTFKKEIVSES